MAGKAIFSPSLHKTLTVLDNGRGVSPRVAHASRGKPVSESKLLTSMEGVFGGHYRHRCLGGLSGRTACEAVMVVPDPETPGAPQVLEEGQIWGCARCGALHEYYIAYKDGGRYGCVRLLLGDDVRESWEPGVTEFMPKDPA